MARAFNTKLKTSGEKEYSFLSDIRENHSPFHD